jgi:FKBP-type peptidyl-prolyl cis-trans isomerase FkpA
MRRSRVGLGLLLALACAACGSDDGAGPGVGKWVTTSSGLAYVDVIVGSGAVATAGCVATIEYSLWLEDGTLVDSTLDREPPFEFPVGEGRVIAGLDEGVRGMRVGGQRRLDIPPGLGYGERGAAGGIPPHARLTMDVLLEDVR